MSAIDRRKAAAKAKAHRERHGLTQAELAALVESTQPIISQAERAFPSVSVRVVKALLELPA